MDRELSDLYQIDQELSLNYNDIVLINLIDS